MFVPHIKLHSPSSTSGTLINGHVVFKFSHYPEVTGGEEGGIVHDLGTSVGTPKPLN